MQIEERPLSPVLKSELDAHLRDGLRTIGGQSIASDAEKLGAKLNEFLIEFEKAKSQFKENQIQLLLVQVGAVLAQLFIMKYGWSWTCAKDENEHDFYFIVSRDKKLMLQPWTFLQDCVQQPDFHEVVKNIVAVPELASQSDEVMKSDLLYQDIGMAFMAMGSLVALSQGIGTILEDGLPPDMESQN
ncbi:MAG: hypothetical protein DKT66_26435 [Candidatus Melainabacteria bacterium]|nr:MAG: hypothetical protein DKT66_26435 [Candidatus Melainabacteria bacterium]